MRLNASLTAISLLFNINFSSIFCLILLTFASLNNNDTWN